MLDICARVDIGLVREKNDDRILLGKDVYSLGEYCYTVSETDYIAAVADGVGGEEYGDEAAEIALKCFVDINTVDEATLKDYIKRANDKVMQRQAEDIKRAKMSTTLAGVFIKGGDLITFNVGDSRVYHIRDGGMRRLTRDHTPVQELLNRGYINEEQAFRHPERNIITRFIGHGQRCVPYISKREGIFCIGDMILLCSDGLTDALMPVEIKRVLNNKSLSLRGRLDELISLTHSRGGYDNTSIILINKIG